MNYENADVAEILAICAKLQGLGSGTLTHRIIQRFGKFAIVKNCDFEHLEGNENQIKQWACAFLKHCYKEYG